MNRFKVFRRDRNEQHESESLSKQDIDEDANAHDSYFGEEVEPTSSELRRRPSFNKETRLSGEQILLRFIKAKLGPQAGNLALRLMNKNPLQEGARFSYVINQSTEGKSTTVDHSITLLFRMRRLIISLCLSISTAIFDTKHTNQTLVTRDNV